MSEPLPTGLDGRHWEWEDYRQRMPVKQWRQILLDENDTVIFRGTCRKLKGKSIGAGVYEVYKDKSYAQKARGE